MNLFLEENVDELETDAIVSEMFGIALRMVERDRSRRAWVDEVKKRCCAQQFAESRSA